MTHPASAPSSGIIGVILAGGQARRMGGGDKALIKLHNKTLLEHAIIRLTPQVAHVILNANGAPQRFDAFALTVVPDSIEDAGPLAGILAGMEWTRANRPQCRHIASVAADTPFFPDDLVARLTAAASDADLPLARAASDGRAHPVFGLWPTDLADDLRRALGGGVRKVDQWTETHGVADANFPIRDSDPFFNINRPEDLNALRKTPAPA